MQHYLDLFIRSVFIENLALSYFLGICTFLAVSRDVKTALGLGAAVIVVQTVTVPVNNLLYQHFLLPRPETSVAFFRDLDLTFLGLIVYVGVIAATVQILEMVLDRFAPALYNAMGIFLPLLVVNCAILGGTLFTVERNYDLGESVVYGFGSGCGWALAVAAMAGIRERLRYADPPAGLRGLGLAFITAGLMALAFMGFRGIVL
ncbi:MAG: NADH:ubiquinone reductase (Na(+)-transporting) subunit E [Planctomycetota bacterium]|nr:NADH:ubiquinone reductase (Na(+)-transporting) subunit E [Planctomycetota bacterium]